MTARCIATAAATTDDKLTSHDKISNYVKGLTVSFRDATI